MVYYTRHLSGTHYGAEFKLDVGTLRLDQQVACQRYRQPILDVKTSGLTAFMAKVQANRQNFAFAV